MMEIVNDMLVGKLFPQKQPEIEILWLRRY